MRWRLSATKSPLRSSARPSLRCSPDATCSAKPRPELGKRPRLHCRCCSALARASSARTAGDSSTRELAMQVAEAIHRYGKGLRTRVLPIYGGQSIQQQLRALRRGVDVIVATPGRALDHIRRGSLTLDRVQVVVLDEADEMLDMGFADD